MGAENGIPRITNDAAAKAYVHSLGEALHYEFKPLGVHVTVLAAGFTNTPVLEKFRFDPKTMPLKPMSVEQCVSEGLSGLLKNRSRIVPGRLNRIMNALVPASLARKIEADMLGKGLASKSAPANARAEALLTGCQDRAWEPSGQLAWAAKMSRNHREISTVPGQSTATDMASIEAISVAFAAVLVWL